jgi:Ca-activated chloride channel family protein
MNTGFTFAQGYGWPTVVVGVIAVVGFAAILIYLERNHVKRIHTFIDLRLARRLQTGGEAVKRKPLFWLTLTGVVFAFIALAQPHWGMKMEEEVQRSHDLLFVLDVSESMLAENPIPSRLERAKQKISSILDRTAGDRYGLIAFSGSAELMCPLTLDQGYFRTILNAVDTDSISLEGTDISTAIELATATYQDQSNSTGETNANSRAIILISDGEQVEGDAVSLATIAGEYARVYVIGVGDPRGTEITYTNRLGRRSTVMNGAAPHISKLDEATLSQIAIEGGGGYIRSTASNRDVEELYGLISQLFTRDVEGEMSERLMNRFQWPLAVAIFCFMAEGFWLVLLPWLRKDEDEYGEQATGEKAHA